MTDSDEVKRMKGVVKWFNDAKGFGFIEHPSGQDVFVHYSVIETEGFRTLKDGEEVEYEIKEGPKGLHAIKVQRTVKPAPRKNTISPVPGVRASSDSEMQIEITSDATESSDEMN